MGSGLQIDGSVVSAVFIGIASLVTYLLSQTSTRAKAQRRELKRLTKRDIAWARWGHAVQVWAARHGHNDIPTQPKELEDEGDEDA